MKKGSKLNKTKRGGERVFTELEQILAESKTMTRPEQNYQAPAQVDRSEMMNQKKKEKTSKAEQKDQNSDNSSEEDESRDKSELSRREKEEMEKERAKAAFWKAQAEGKTEQAKSDMARLLIIRKQREEAARKRAEDQDGKAGSSQRQDSINAGKGIISKTLGK